MVEIKYSGVAEYLASVNDYEPIKNIRAMKLESLVRMTRTSLRDQDRVHIRDLIAVGLVDETWLDRFSTPLSLRWQALLDTPGG